MGFYISSTDYTLSRRPDHTTATQPSLPITAGLHADGTLVEEPSRAEILMHSSASDVLLLLHGFQHTLDNYQVHSEVLAVSAPLRTWLHTRADLLLYVNAPHIARAALLDALKLYQLGPSSTRLLMHTSLDAGHQCAATGLTRCTQSPLHLCTLLTAVCAPCTVCGAGARSFNFWTPRGECGRATRGSSTYRGRTST